MLSNLWARVTGADKKRQYPEQQGVALGRVGDYTVVFPYGVSADLPEDALLYEIAPGIAVPVTVARPGDTERGEPVFFHPATNARIVCRTDGSIDVIAPTVNIIADETAMTGNLTVAGDVQIGGDLNNDGTATLGGSGGQPIARTGDSTNGSSITGGSSSHTAT